MEKKLTKVDFMKEVKRILHANGYKNVDGMSHVRYDESVNEEHQYKIIRSSKHDGTLLFTLQLIEEIALLLMEKRSYYTEALKDKDHSKVYDVRYEIGDGELETSFEGLKQTDIVSLPVRFYCEFK